MFDRPFLSGAVLKVIAIVTMFIDHITLVLIDPLLGISRFPEIVDKGIVISGTFQGLDLNAVYEIGRGIGRISFPLFVFMLAEGFYHTKNRAKYLVRLLIFTFISEIPFDLGFYHKPFYFGHQNVFFTLFLGGLAISIIEFLMRRDLDSPLARLLSLALSIAVAGLIIYVARLLNTDYDSAGVAAILIMYFMGETGNGRVMRRETREGRDDIYEVITISFKLRRLVAYTISVVILGILSHRTEFIALINIVPIALYNGSRGRQSKLFFYIAYPAHLIILFFVYRAVYG